MTKRKKQLLLVAALLIVAATLQHTFWFGKSSYKTLKETQALIEAEDRHIEELQKRNNMVTAEIVDLKTKGEGMEERARMELGYVKEGETFYRVIETNEVREYTKVVVEDSNSE